MKRCPTRKSARLTTASVMPASIHRWRSAAGAGAGGFDFNECFASHARAAPRRAEDFRSFQFEGDPEDLFEGLFGGGAMGGGRRGAPRSRKGADVGYRMNVRSSKRRTASRR